MALARDFAGPAAAFADSLMLHQGPDQYDERAERVTLMTFHAAKGLEFPVVFLAGCEDGIVPYARPGETPDLDEERRLLYVAMTRAKHLLYVTTAAKRTLFGQTAVHRLSPFLEAVPERLRLDLKPSFVAPPKPKQLELEL